ncbi:MAG: NAD-binding protein [Candidatus Hydrothermarchaeaceae archaeon]
MIIGGGRLGLETAKLLLESDNEVIIFEKDKEVAESIARELDALVINSDGTDMTRLEDAGLEDVDIFMPLTGSDETNLMVSQIAKDKVKKIIARSNKESNKKLYEKIGVDIALVPLSTSAIAFRDAVLSDIKTLLLLDGEFEVIEHVIKNGSIASGRNIKDIKFPIDARIIIMYREDKAMIPTGDTLLKSGDRVVVLGSRNKLKKVISVF